MKKKLLIITQVLDEGDSNLGFFCRWAAEYAKQVEHLYIIAVRVGAYHLPDNVTVLSLGKEQGITRIKRLFLFWKYCFLYGRKADAIFVHMCPEYVLYGAGLLRSKKRKLGLWYLHKSVTLKLRLVEKMVDFIFTAHMDGVRIQSDKIMVTGHGIDLSLFSAYTSSQNAHEPLRLITIGRITPSKNLLLLLRVVKMLNIHSEVIVTLDIVGEAYLSSDRAYEATLHQEIKKLGIEHAVRFVGKVEYASVPALYKNVDVFVSASKTGGIDKAILEAMASQLPVVTSNEAFRNILPTECMFQEANLEECVAKIKNYRVINREALYTYVQREHSLGSTVAKIVTQLF